MNVDESEKDYSEIERSAISEGTDAAVCIPVEVTPHADSGEIKAYCCGKPTEAFREDRGSGKCCIRIIQPICVEIPLEFGAEALIGSLHIMCGEDTYTECKPVQEETGGGNQSESEQEPMQPRPLYWYKTFY